MRDLIIICEDSFGLDVLEIAEASLAYYKIHYPGLVFNIKGFLCPVQIKDQLDFSPYPYLGTADEWLPLPDERFAMGILDPYHKKQIAEMMKSKGGKFMILWAPWVLAPITMQFGEGSIIAAQSIKMGAEIGAFTTLFHCMVGDAKIGDYCSVMAWSNVTDVSLGQMSYVSDNVAIMMDLSVGENVCICPNSIVVKNLKANTKVSGIPARKVREK